MWASLARTADESISIHAQEGPFQLRPTAKKSARTCASLVACVRDPIVIFVDKAWKNFQGFRIERVSLRGMRSSFMGCVSAPRIRRSIVHHGQCQSHLDIERMTAAPLNLILQQLRTRVDGKFHLRQERIPRTCCCVIHCSARLLKMFESSLWFS